MHKEKQLNCRSIAWGADTHFNFVNDNDRTQFYEKIRGLDCDAVILAGDISVGPYLSADIEAISNAFGRPVIFSLGNHDRWGSSQADTEATLRSLIHTNENVFWLDQEGPLSIGAQTAVVGVDNWVDAPMEYPSLRKPRDWYRISDFFGLPTDEMKALSEKYAQTASDRLEAILNESARRFGNVIVVMHHPPLFKEWPADIDPLPLWLGSLSCGEVITSVAARNPETQFLILAGHLHQRAKWQIAENIEVRIAGSEYGNPSIEEIISIDPGKRETRIEGGR